MKQIGIKLADGSFYPILEDGQPASKKLGLTTVMDNQSRVVVDLYRSDTGTMEDAEYIDSLQINNLIAHPKVSVDIPLKITLDENNRLSAVLIDPETGATSNANITLVSRTLEERLEPMNYDVKMEDDDFDIPETVDLENENALEKSAEKSNASAAKVAGAVAAVAAGGGLLAKMMAKQNEKNEATPSEKNSERLSDAMANKADALKDISEKAEYEIPEIDEPDFAESATESTDSNEPIENTADDIFSESNAAENSAEEKSPFDDMLPDFSDSADDELPSFDDDLSLPEIGENPTEEISGVPEESAIDETKDAPANSVFDDTLDFDLPDFGESSTESADPEDPFSSLDSLDGTDKTLEGDPSLDSPSEENENAQKADESEDPFALPDFDKSENAAATDSTNELNELELPDFPEIENSKTDNLSDLDLPDFPETESSKTDGFSEFDLPDFPSEENLNMNDDNFMDTAYEKDDDIFADSPENTMAETGNALDFDGLYDKETVAGTSYSEGNSTAEEIRKKTKIPVLICLVCAVICIIAVVFMLLVVPSKYNLLGKRKADTHEQVVTEQKITESISAPAPVPESMPESKPAPQTQAKEDEIVIVTEPEIVETVEPEKPAEPEKPKVITYKIKWGDTLWDIANAYYKNPWRYRMIARYNNIKNPDYIISGTTIQLPQE